MDTKKGQLQVVSLHQRSSNRLHYLLLLVFAPTFISVFSLSTTQISPLINIQENNIMKILCVGICSLDTLATLDEFPSPDAKVRSKSLVHAGGGNAANTAVAISRLSHNISLLNHLNIRVDLLSAVGNDANGDSIINGLESENIGTTLIERFHGDSPWSYIMIVGDTRTIIHQPSTRDLSIDFVHRNVLDGDVLSTYSAVHFDLRHPQAAICVANECKKLGIPYSVDVERPRDGLLEILSGASVVICNSNYVNLVLNQEGDQYKKDYSDEEIVQRFKKVLKDQAPCATIGVMTLGSKGSCLVTLDADDDKDGVVCEGVPSVAQRFGALWCQPFEIREVVDTTGAGDAFQGGFISAIWGYSMHQRMRHQSKDIKMMSKTILSHALRIASRVAAKKIEKSGARDGIPKKDPFIESEVIAMME